VKVARLDAASADEVLEFRPGDPHGPASRSYLASPDEVVHIVLIATPRYSATSGTPIQRPPVVFGIHKGEC
jgi:hypothetical protein